MKTFTNKIQMCSSTRPNNVRKFSNDVIKKLDIVVGTVKRKENTALYAWGTILVFSCSDLVPNIQRFSPLAKKKQLGHKNGGGWGPALFLLDLEKFRLQTLIF